MGKLFNSGALMPHRVDNIAWQFAASFETIDKKATTVSVTAYLNNNSGQRDKNITDFLPLVRHLVGRMAINAPAYLDSEDLVEAGVVGLIAAVDSYQPAMGATLKTFAYTKVKGAILDELRKASFISRGDHQKIKQLQDTYHKLQSKHNRPPTFDELRQHLDIGQEELARLMTVVRCQSFLSIDQTLGNSESHSSLNSLLACPKHENPGIALEKKELQNRLASAIGDLDEQERQVIVLYYYQDLLLKEISEILKVSASRVSHLHSQALYKLNQMLRSEE